MTLIPKAIPSSCVFARADFAQGTALVSRPARRISFAMITIWHSVDRSAFRTHSRRRPRRLFRGYGHLSADWNGENNGACGRCNETVGGPVRVSNGNMYLQQNDYHLPSVGQAISVSRTYNSDSQTVGLFGRGWSTQYDEAVISYDATLLSFNQGDGRAIYFTRPVTSSAAFVDLIGDYQARVTQGAAEVC